MGLPSGEQGAGLLKAGIVEGDIDSAEAFEGEIKHRGHVADQRNIGLKEQRLAAEPLTVTYNVVTADPVSADDDHMGAPPGKRARH